MNNAHVLWFDHIGMEQIADVGGKNASLGEMYCQLKPLGVQVPPGFATTSYAYRQFMSHHQLQKRIDEWLSSVSIEDVSQLHLVGQRIRQAIIAQPLTPEFEKSICDAYRILDEGNEDDSYAVRSSATAEDLPTASFAGQQETYLNIKGEESLLKSIKAVYASLYNDRAITYRVHQGFEHDQVAISVGVQKMVRSDLGASGVMFTLDTETGFDRVVFVTSSFGLGEAVVQGAVNPDEFYLYKPALENGKSAILRRRKGSKQIKMIYGSEGDHEQVKTVPVNEEERNHFSISDDDLQLLASHALTIEKHYGRAMDIEWAKDGKSGELYILQARPETIHHQKETALVSYRLVDNSNVEILLEGRAVGEKIASGMVRVLNDLKEMDRVEEGDILVTDMTDPDWEPVLKKVAGVVTNRGGRTCHAAIIARELGIPAVVGTQDATEVLSDGQPITMSCAEGDTGYIYKGLLEVETNRVDISEMPDLPVKIMMNVANPDRAFQFASIPNHGVGLARLEFIINQMIGIHPRSVLEYADQDPSVQQMIAALTAGYRDPVEYYVTRLAEGISTIASAFDPRPVIVRLSDFKSNEYAHLIGGDRYEPREENPMLGFRGAARYLSDSFRKCFELECRAIRYVRETMGLENIWIMIPFVRTTTEAELVIDLLQVNGLRRGERGLKIMMMCELPSNALLAEEFLSFFDGFSIGSNDLTQLTLGVDRDSAIVADRFDERNAAVQKLLKMSIQACHRQGKYIGICGQGPSDHLDLAEWLMAQGIESLSLNPDTVVSTWMSLANTRA